MTGSRSEFDVTVSPNPLFKDFVFNVSGSADDNILVELFDVTGRLLEAGEVTNSTYTMAGDALSPGVYMALILSGDQMKSIRIVKTQ